jgi:hypothetical protein
MLLLEILFITLMRGIDRVKEFMIYSVHSLSMIHAGNSFEFAIIERPGLGDDGRLFPPYVNGVPQPFVVLYHDR